MGGYWGRRSGATAVHDPLWARAVVWRRGKDGCVLVSLDLVGVTSGWVAGVRQRICLAQPFVAPEAIMICCTHTHAGPLSLPFRGMGDMDEAYLSVVSDAVVASVAEASAGLRDATMRYARPPVQIGINRRQARSGATAIGANPDGPVAPWAHVLQLQTSSGRAVLFQHACHPVVLGSSNHEISADFPGAACAHVEAETGAFALYVNGAAADINPSPAGATFADVEALGRALGAAVSGAVDGAGDETGRLPDDSIGWGQRQLSLPLQPAPSVARATVEMIRQGLNVARNITGDAWQQRVPRARLLWARDWLGAALPSRSQQTQSFEIQALQIGNITWLAMEGEIFVRYQLDLEASVHSPIVLCGFANGCIGYVPTRNEYGRGGYEIETAYQVYPSVLMIAPESDELIRRETGLLLASLAASER